MLVYLVDIELLDGGGIILGSAEAEQAGRAFAKGGDEPLASHKRGHLFAAGRAPVGF